MELLKSEHGRRQSQHLVGRLFQQKEVVSSYLIWVMMETGHTGSCSTREGQLLGQSLITLYVIGLGCQGK